MTLVKSFPLFASVAPFFLLMVLHLECPDIVPYPFVDRGPGPLAGPLAGPSAGLLDDHWEFKNNGPLDPADLIWWALEDLNL